MLRMPERFKRVAEAFEELAKVRVCESSGSEHSPESLTDLSDLVNSFIERGNGESWENEEKEGELLLLMGDSDESYGGSDSETKDLLKNLMGCEDGDDDDDVRRKVYAEAEQICSVIGKSSSPGFKRRLMTWLREGGFDAGVCKSRWEKNGRLPSGNYEYIDVNVAETRYIIDVSLAREFEIARPTDRYASLLEVFPPICVCKIEELKLVVRIMCNAIKKSMKDMDMGVPPWRRHRYIHAKWFGSYKRTVNEFSGKSVSDPDYVSSMKRTVGFVSLP